MTLCILGFFWLMRIHIYLVDRQMRFHGPLAVGNIVDQFFRNLVRIWNFAPHAKTP